MERRPRIRRLEFCDAAGVFPGVARLRSVHRGAGAADVDEHEPQGAADRGVGAPAGAEHATPAVDAQPRHRRTVHDDERRARVRRGLAMRKAVGGVRYRLQRGHDHRQIFRLAACHHGIDSNMPHRCGAHARRHHADHFVGGAPRHARKHRLNTFFSGRHDRQTVGPAVLVEIIVYGVVALLRLDDAGRVSFHRQISAASRHRAKDTACLRIRGRVFPRAS
ncbi:hypothetical protein D3C83_03110 [compost metagenome]